jgi:Tn3 transposase DDE domain
MTALSAGGRAAARGEPKGVSPGALDRFAVLAGALEQAASAIARFDALSTGHPLISAWLWRTRLEAVRRHAGCDGLMIDPWHLAAMIEGVRFRMDRAAAIIDRGAIFEAARHAFQLWGWFAWPDAAQMQAIERAAAGLSASGHASPLLGAALAVRAWLDQGGGRPPLRAALALHWQRCGLTHVKAPLLTGAKAFGGEMPRQIDDWVAEFLAALAEEAEAGIALLHLLEREWFAARPAIRGRRRDSHAAAAVDLMAAAPIVSATSLAHSLDIALWNTVYLGRALDELRRGGEIVPDPLLGHLAPVGWQHINLTGDYLWDADAGLAPDGYRLLRALAAITARAA